MKQTANLNSDEYAVVVRLTQSQSQYDSLSLELIRVTESQNAAGLPVDTILRREYDGEARYYKIPDPERMDAVTSGYKYIQTHAREWASNCDDTSLELYRWGIDDPADDAPAPDYDGDCLIVRVCNYYDYAPIDYVLDGDMGPIIFSNPADAQEWIDKAGEESYECAHNEAGRPTYYIVESK